MAVDPRQIFNDSWDSYTQLLASNGLYHTEQYTALRDLFTCRFPRPFSLLDLGCGDAGNLCDKLAVGGRLNVERYVGIDLSKDALALARERLPAVVAPGTPVTLHHLGMLEFLRTCNDSFDVIISTFAMHHLSTEDKAAVIQEAARLLAPQQGIFVVVDAFRNPGESRTSALDRFTTHFQAQPLMTPFAKKLLCDHVWECDHPETIETYEQFGRLAGFSRPEVLYTDAQQMGRLLVMHTS
ncbi:hypothetical protein WJX72_003825 [[Myrmecia] bisecta]|uniref:Methyltransferase domain-containing protein n=1 Tax=[Myrmecia] bisecta TaxID=41462 RepID=A0AAW1PGL6_9CHLO